MDVQFFDQVLPMLLNRLDDNAKFRSPLLIGLAFGAELNAALKSVQKLSLPSDCGDNVKTS